MANRQLEVLWQLARGESVKEVAQSMVISERAIERHEYRIMQNLGIHDRVKLAHSVIREGLTSLERFNEFRLAVTLRSRRRHRRN